MRVATYQPEKGTEIVNPSPAVRKVIIDKLGFNPLWVFLANNEKEFWVNSLLSVPVCPDELWIFDVPDEDIYCVDKVMWDRYLNSFGKDEEPVICKAVELSPNDYYKYEFLIRDSNYKCIGGVDFHTYLHSKLQWAASQNMDRVVSYIDSQVQDRVQTGKNLYKLFRDKTEDQYIDQSVMLFARNFFLCADAFGWYKNHIEDGGYAMKEITINVADDHYNGSYTAYDREPSYEKLELMHQNLSGYFTK